MILGRLPSNSWAASGEIWGSGDSVHGVLSEQLVSGPNFGVVGEARWCPFKSKGEVVTFRGMTGTSKKKQHASTGDISWLFEDSLRQIHLPRLRSKSHAGAP